MIDETGAAQMLVPENKRRKTITAKEVEACIATMARIPPKSVSRDDREVLKNLDRDLKMVVFGQDPAIEALVSAIKLARAGLRDPEKPIGSYLFSGPTGVGKTEVARQLARTLGIEITRFDMSEYMERHTVSRLIGAPPGYVGFDQGGLLTDAIDQHPHSVLLLDEIEKAHPDLFNILLQVMDYGKLTDHNGKNVDFRNVILIMTTNAGASDLAKPAIGFGSGIREGDDQEAINRMFTPEFRNRLDAVISFAALAPETIGRVVDKFVLQLEEQLADRNVTIELDAGARDWLAKKGYDPLFGARPLGRVIQEHIKKPLAEELLFGALAKGGIVRVSVDKEADKLVFAFRQRPRQPTEEPQEDEPKEEPNWSSRLSEAGRGRSAGRREALARRSAAHAPAMPQRRALRSPARSRSPAARSPGRGRASTATAAATCPGSGRNRRRAGCRRLPAPRPPAAPRKRRCGSRRAGSRSPARRRTTAAGRRASAPAIPRRRWRSSSRDAARSSPTARRGRGRCRPAAHATPPRRRRRARPSRRRVPRQARSK